MLQSFLYQCLFLHFCIGEIGQKVAIAPSYTRHTRWYKEEIYTVDSLIQCSSLCYKRSDWCFSYYYDKGTKLCEVTSIMISPYHQDTVDNMKMFHTFLKKDLVFNSIVTSSRKSNTFPEATVLSKGIYNYNKIETCAGLVNDATKYIMFDLRKLYLIREIRVTTQPDDYEPDLPRNAEIKVGKDKPIVDGQFTTFELFGTMPSDAQQEKTYTIKPNVEYVEGQYVAIIADGGQSTVVICYVQIFE